MFALIRKPKDSYNLKLRSDVGFLSDELCYKAFISESPSGNALNSLDVANIFSKLYLLPYSTRS